MAGQLARNCGLLLPRLPAARTSSLRSASFFTNARGLVPKPSPAQQHRSLEDDLEEDENGSPRTRGRSLFGQPAIRHCFPTMYYRRGGQHHLNPPLDSRSALVFQQPQPLPSTAPAAASPFLEEFQASGDAYRGELLVSAEEISADEALLEAAAEEMEFAQAGFLAWDVPEVIFDRELYAQELEMMERGIIGSDRRGIRQYAIRSDRVAQPQDTLEVIYQCDSVHRKRRLKIKRHKWRKARKQRRRSNA